MASSARPFSLLDLWRSQPLLLVNSLFLYREPTAEEIHAAEVISQSIQQFSKANLESSMVPGSEANLVTRQLLKESLPILELMKKKLGAMLLQWVVTKYWNCVILTSFSTCSGMIRLDPCIAEKLPFAEDLATMAYSATYTGLFPAIQANSWTIILRYTKVTSFPEFVYRNLFPL